MWKIARIHGSERAFASFPTVHPSVPCPSFLPSSEDPELGAPLLSSLLPISGINTSHRPVTNEIRQNVNTSRFSDFSRSRKEWETGRIGLKGLNMGRGISTHVKIFRSQIWSSCQRPTEFTSAVVVFLDSISESIVLRSACRNLRFIRCMRGFNGPISKRQFLAAFAFLVLRSDLLLIPQRLLVIHLK